MGIVNVTPDSFSDGGRFWDSDAAIVHGLSLFADGARIVDVGGESTRPGADPVEEMEERRRVLPVVAELARHGRVSVDTTKAGVAEAALAAGATIVNDLSAELWPLAAAAGPGVAWIVVHRQGDPRTMQVEPRYGDVVTEVLHSLVAVARTARVGGVREVYIDPGVGFGKTARHNVELLGALGRFVDSGLPVCLGVSRKAILGALTAFSGDLPHPHDREEASLAIATLAFSAGVQIVRAHRVKPAVHALRLARELVTVSQR